MGRLIEMTKDVVTGAYRYVEEKVTAASNWVAGTAVAGLAAMGSEVQATGECATTSIICTKFVAGVGPIFVDLQELSFWLVVGLLTIVFIFYAYKRVTRTTGG